jgi:hypothetical protein
MTILSADQTAPARNWKAITPDAAIPAGGCRAIFVGGAGNITATDEAGNTVEFVGLVAGQILPISPRVVTAASTATLMVALY